MAGFTKEDDKYFYKADGSKSSKNGLSQAKRDAYSAEIEKKRMAESMPSLKDDRFDTQTDFETISDPMNLSRNEAPQMSMAPQQPVLGMPVQSNPMVVNPMAAPQPMAAQPIPVATQDLTPYNVPMPKTQVVTEKVSGVPITKAETDAIAKGFDAQIQAAKDIGIAQSAASVEIAKANEAAQRQIDQVEHERSLIAERKQQAVNIFDAKYADTMKQIQDAKIDPDRFYSGSVGKRVLAGIAIAFGSFGSALTGQRNTALDIINKAIDDDINAQKEGIQKLGNQAQLQRQFMADIRTKFADQDQAQLVQKAAALDMAGRKVAEITGKLSNQEQHARGQALAGQLENQKVEYLMKAKQMAADKVATKTMQEFGGVGANPKVEATKAATPLRKEYMDHPVTKQTMLRRESMNTLNAAAAENSASGDLAFIYAYMKMLDPTSTVREGEFASAQNAGGVPDSIRNLANKLATGERLNPEQRKSFVSTAGSIYGKQIKEQEVTDERFNKLSMKTGLDPADVIEPWGFSRPAEEISSTFKPKAEAQPVKNIMKGR